MRKLLAVMVILVFSGIAFASPAEATHEKYTFRYVTGSATGGGVLTQVCTTAVDGVSLSIGGACTRPCPHGTCDITVTDDHYGERVRFRIQIDDEPFFRAQSFKHEAHVEGEKVRVGVRVDLGTTGIITIE